MGALIVCDAMKACYHVTQAFMEADITTVVMTINDNSNMILLNKSSREFMSCYGI